MLYYYIALKCFIIISVQREQLRVSASSIQTPSLVQTSVEEPRPLDNIRWVASLPDLARLLHGGPQPPAANAQVHP